VERSGCWNGVEGVWVFGSGEVRVAYINYEFYDRDTKIIVSKFCMGGINGCMEQCFIFVLYWK